MGLSHQRRKQSRTPCRKKMQKEKLSTMAEYFRCWVLDEPDTPPMLMTISLLHVCQGTKELSAGQSQGGGSIHRDLACTRNQQKKNNLELNWIAIDQPKQPRKKLNLKPSKRHP